MTDFESLVILGLVIQIWFLVVVIWLLNKIREGEK